MTALARRLRGLLAAVPEHGQQRARRNALAGCTELAQRRRELDEVEEFLATVAAPDRGHGPPDRARPA